MKNSKWLNLIILIVFRHNIQTDYEAENAVLHGESNYPVCWDFIPHSIGLLPPVGLRRESDTLHLHTFVPHCVLPAVGRNHSTDLFGSATSWKVFTFYNGSRHFIHLCHCGGPQCSLQVNSLYTIHSTLSYLSHHHCHSWWLVQSVSLSLCNVFCLSLLLACKTHRVCFCFFAYTKCIYTTRHPVFCLRKEVISHRC